ncbi:MAG: hypothetical protein ACREQY_10975, partial [Candidatus Binatia bacterium]
AAPKPTPVPPIALASVEPSSSALRLPFRGEQVFEARVEGADSTSVSWELDGKVVGRGERFRLNEATRPKPGRHRLELVATRGRERKVLRSWQVEVAPEALRFAALQPAERALEESVGGTVRFRAPIESDAPDELSWAWEVNGRRAEGARGPSYEFAARDPGRYDVKVRAVAPSGASIDNTWTLTVSRPAVPTPAVRVNPEAELLGWIDAYCRAFEQRDTDTLLALGHLGSRSEAERLREALSVMRDLRLSCTNPSVRVDGDQATVSFDRTDRWMDPRGQTMERSLPRITKDLRRANDRWVATP